MNAFDEAREFLVIAKKDLKAASLLSDAEEIYLEAVCFLIQQAAEKALKAWIIALNLQYPITHNLDVLLSRLEENKEDVHEFWSIIELTPFAVQFRYQSFDNDAFGWEELYSCTLDLLHHVENRIKELET